MISADSKSAPIEIWTEMSHKMRYGEELASSDTIISLCFVESPASIAKHIFLTVYHLALNSPDASKTRICI